MKRNRMGNAAAAAALAALTVLVGAAGGGSPRPAHADVGAEPAKTTKLLPALPLPAGAARITDAETRKGMEANLSTLVKEAGLKIVASETLVWGGVTGAAAQKRMDEIAAALKAAGYPYGIVGTEDTEGGRATVFTAIHPGKKDPLFGMWLRGKDFLLLAWGRGAAPKAAATSAPAAATPAAPKMAARPGHFAGTVRTRGGKPVAGADVRFEVTAPDGGQAVARAGTDERGAYDFTALPSHQYKYYEPYLTMGFDGKEHQFPLLPTDGEPLRYDDQEFLPVAKGAVRNFLFPVSGLKDPKGRADDPNNHFGFAVAIDPSDGAAGHTIEVTLTPLGALLDGTAGKSLSYSHKLPAPVPSDYRFTIYGVPLGRYKMTRRLLAPSGAEVPFRLSTEGIFRGISIPGMPRELVVGPGSLELKNFTDAEAKRYNVTVTGSQD